MSNSPATRLTVPCIGSAVLLALAIGPWPYGYYTLLRWVVTASAVYVAYHNFAVNRIGWAWTFVFIAILFNPIAPIHLSRAFWGPIDIATGIAFVAALVTLWQSPQDREIGNQ